MNGNVQFYQETNKINSFLADPISLRIYDVKKKLIKY